jgi:hypothetical protein
MSRLVTLKKDISPILINQRTTPYRLDSFDKLQVKLVLNNKGRKSRLNNVPVEFYLNYTDNFVKYVDTTTDSNGIANINFSCQNIEHNLVSCTGYVKVIVDSVVYTSNLIRFNFCAGSGSEHEVYLYPSEIMLYGTDIINI